MTIGDFYLRRGETSLNLGLFFNIISLATAVLLSLFHRNPFPALAFFINGIVYYLFYRHFLNRAIRSRAFLYSPPAGSGYFLCEFTGKEIFCFSPDGQARFFFRSSKGEILVYERDGNHWKACHSFSHCKLFPRPAKRDHPSQKRMDRIRIYRVQYNRWMALKGRRAVAEIQYGWMPLQWTKLFPLNTPVIFFQEVVTEEEKMGIIYALAYCAWKKRSHYSLDLGDSA